MTEILEFWRNGTKLKKALAAFGLFAFVLGVAINAKEFYDYFLAPDSVDSRTFDFKGLQTGEELDEFLQKNNGKIVWLSVFYNYNLFVTSSIEGNKHSLLTIYSDKPSLKFFYFCHPEGLEKIQRRGEYANLGPIDCLTETLIISGDTDKYRFNRTAGTYFLEGHFFVEFVHMAQGQRFYNLKAIHPGEMTNFIAEHQ